LTPEIELQTMKNMTINTATTITNCLSTVKSKLTSARQSRDKQNNETKAWTVKRNSLNQEVKLKISEVKSHRTARDNHNHEVRRWKKMRNQFQSDYKKMASSKKDSNSSSDDEHEKRLTALMERQQNAHKAMKNEAALGQKQHELMLEVNQSVDSIQKKAQSAHKKLRASKKKADQLHNEYIVLLRCQHACQDIPRAIDRQDAEDYSQEQEHEQASKRPRNQSHENENLDDVFENVGL
jgi:uncharacterized coiled-coil DUF342 family protein